MRLSPGDYILPYIHSNLTFRTSADALIANFPPVGMSTLTCLVGVDEALGFYLPVAQ